MADVDNLKTIEVKDLCPELQSFVCGHGHTLPTGDRATLW
jgi:hypothetical protein